MRNNLLWVSVVPTVQPNNILLQSFFVIMVADSSLNLLWQYFGNPAAKHTYLSGCLCLAVWSGTNLLLKKHLENLKHCRLLTMSCPWINNHHLCIGFSYQLDLVLTLLLCLVSWASCEENLAVTRLSSVLLLMLGTPMSLTTLYIRYDEELALADAREREVKSRTGHRGKLKTEPRKPLSWKWLNTTHTSTCGRDYTYFVLHVVIQWQDTMHWVFTFGQGRGSRPLSQWEGPFDGAAHAVKSLSNLDAAPRMIACLAHQLLAW